MATYNVGSNNVIHADVFVSTEGVASTTVFQKRGSASKIRIAISELESGGIIPKEKIGTSISLINSLILFLTNVRFLSDEVEDKNLDSAINNTSVTYTLLGGSSGDKSFAINENDIIISDDKRSITFLKFVEVIF